MMCEGCKEYQERIADLETLNVGWERQHELQRKQIAKLREQSSLDSAAMQKLKEETPYPRKLSDDAILGMLENSLFCGKCWGRMIRTMTHDKFMVRLIKFYNGKYSWKYHPYAIKALLKALDRLENKKLETIRKEVEQLGLYEYADEYAREILGKVLEIIKEVKG